MTITRKVQPTARRRGGHSSKWKGRADLPSLRGRNTDEKLTRGYRSKGPQIPRVPDEEKEEKTRGAGGEKVSAKQKKVIESGGPTPDRQG